MPGGRGAPEILRVLQTPACPPARLQVACWVPRNRAPALRHLSALGSLRKLTYSLPGLSFSVPGLAQLSGLSELKVCGQRSEALGQAGACQAGGQGAASWCWDGQPQLRPSACSPPAAHLLPSS